MGEGARMNIEELKVLVETNAVNLVAGSCVIEGGRVCFVIQEMSRFKVTVEMTAAGTLLEKTWWEGFCLDHDLTEYTAEAYAKLLRCEDEP